MSLSKKGNQVIDLKLPTSCKSTSLNPDAAEFIPFALRTPPAVSTVDTDASAKFSVASGSSGKAVINRTESAVSNNSDDEAHQFWRHQLPDDITPDFKVIDEDVSQGLGGLSLAGLSLCDDSDAVRLSTSAVGGFPLSVRQGFQPDQFAMSSSGKKLGYGGSSMSEDASQGWLLSCNPWDKPVANNDLIFGSGTGAAPFKGASKPTFGGDVFSDHSIVDDVDVASNLEFLGLNFPGFAADSLAEVYFANGCDLNMTIEMLTKLEVHSSLVGY
ncbi:hypothetical protein MLD38_014216 [Melastoma candidum]|uniref:Uncharacterized protein n=1 Tax=Melastoma candidum TaxID=119954 RepID=A0ACB9RBF7_9MYRT|nr:hypothetical protein MLD38_014216 [Melastoma candidum]